ncbi:MAG: outer membrane beta-barrel protein [Gammaproteobacteria bacterium]
MKIMKTLIGSLMLAALPLAAQADNHGMSYSYIDAGYNEMDLDSVASGDGVGVRGSVGFAENFFAFADYGMFDFSGGADVDAYQIGLGGRLGVSDKVDLVGRVGYTKLDLSAGALSADEDGYLVSAGVRGELADGFELEGSVIYRDFGGSSGDDTAFAVGGRYFFTDNFAVTADFESGDDIEIIFAGVRFSF